MLNDDRRTSYVCTLCGAAVFVNRYAHETNLCAECREDARAEIRSTFRPESPEPARLGELVRICLKEGE